MSIVSKEIETDEDALSISQGRHTYTNDYKNIVFQVWYANGKPGGRRLRELIEPDEINNIKPTVPLLYQWTVGEFKPKAIFMDEQVAKELETRMVAEKVKMLDRHAKTGVKMQDMAIEYIEEHKDEIRIPTALKMLVDGVEMERASRGIPQALEKMLNKSDDDILRAVQELMNKGSVEIEQIESSIEIDNEEVVD